MQATLKVKAVLFDLDGTLLDTALDLAKATNFVLKKYGRKEGISDKTAREYASDGMRALMKAGIPVNEWANYDLDNEMRSDFLEYYHAHINERTVYFEGIKELLQALKSNNIPYGIVTSKPHNLTMELISKFEELKDLKGVAGCDLLPFEKPRPEPLFYVCEKLGVAPEDCIYLGDHKRDIEAAKNAHIISSFALWGYIGKDHDPLCYGADYIVKTPKEFSSILGITL